MSSPTSSPVKIVRPTRTYGRRKPIEAPDAQTPLPKALIVDTSPSVSNTSPTNSVSLDDVPPSSDDAGFGETSFNDDDDSHGESDVQDTLSDGMDDVAGSSKYARRSLQDALAQIDEQFDNEDMDVDPSDTRQSGPGEKGNLWSKGVASGSISDDPFDGPIVKPTASRLVERDGASPPRVARRLTKQTRYLNDSDSESPAEQAQTSAHSSPEALHPINTPNTHSSPTPPTSQDMAPVSAKQKGKARQRSHSVEEDDSDGMLPTVRSSKTRSGRTSKSKRVKAPTKKELLETQKATARIKADQRPTLPRRENKLRISSLFEKLSNGLRGLPSHKPTPENPTALHSDPIQPFSSSPARPTETFIARPSTLRPPPSRSSSSTVKPASREFGPSGLLGDDEDEAESSSKPPRTPTKAQDDVFQSNGLLDGNGGSPAPVGMSDDEEMPSVGQILNEANREKEQTEMQRKLREAKLQYIQKQQQQAVDDEDDSDLEIVNDDMHTVAKEEDKDRRSRKAKHIAESVGRQKQLTAAGKASLIRSPTKTSTLRGGKRDFEILSAAAAPLFSEALSKARKGKGRGDAHVNQKDLNQLLLHASDKQSRELTAQKEAEFAKRVGQRREEEPSVDKAGLLEMLARRSRENRAREDSSDGDDEGEGDDENDRDWMPDNENENENDMDEDGDISEGMTDLPIATDDDVGPLDAEDDDDDENDENIPMRVGRSAGRPRAVFDSDDDDDDSENRPATGRVLVAGSSVVLEPPADLEVPHPMLSHRSSVSSMSERLEEGTDKENDFRLMFDRGDDKENTAVASQSGSTVVSPLAALRGGSGIFSLPSLGRTASTSSVLGLNPTPPGEERSPLQELPTGDEDEDVFLTPSTKQTMHRPSFSKSPLLSQSLSPLQFRSSGKGKGLSSLFEDDEAAGPSSTPGAPAFSLEPAADIRPGGGGLSQFFAASGQAGASPAPVQLGKPIGFSQFMTPIKPTEPSGSRPPGDLALTLGQSLQPALEVDESLLRQADNIFEKEQEFIVEEGARVPRSAAKPLFINRHGFLTQTKPPSSPASPAFAVAGPSVTRQPLSTIALSRMSEGEDEEEEEENLRPRRLRRRSSTPEKLQGYRSSPSPSPAKPRNAFDLLGHKPGRIKAPQFDKKRLMERNEFIEGEAEESDEDAGFGFGVPKKKDEEEELDGEDQDQVLEELVDDAHMDDDTLNEERVLEKVQEHRALDDAADEKIARDAAEGKMRVKRRNNLLDFDDDESDEESWEAKRARERMAKKRRIEGDTLEQIEKNPETQAFAAAYRVDDDEDEFAHLDHEDTSFFGLPDGGRGVDDDDEDSDEEEREVVDASALREQLQRVARGEETVETIDVDDVQWLNADDDDDMDNIRTRELDMSHKQPFGAGPSNDMEWDLMKPRRDLTSEDLARQQKWARSEGSTRNIGTGRASAVTGMNKSAKTGSGSMPSRRKGLAGPTTASSTQGAKKVAKAPSVLSAVSGRRSRFA